jgi:hypothetical protein
MSKCIQDSDESNETVKSDSEPLSQIDRFLLTSMLAKSQDNLVPLTPDTVIGGVTVRQILEWGDRQLYLDLKPKTPMEAVLVSLLVRAHKAAGDCFGRAERSGSHLPALEINLRYAFKAADVALRLLQELENYRARQARRELRHDMAEIERNGEVAARLQKTNGHTLPGRSKGKRLNGNGHHA